MFVLFLCALILAAALLDVSRDMGNNRQGKVFVCPFELSLPKLRAAEDSESHENGTAGRKVKV